MTHFSICIHINMYASVHIKSREIYTKMSIIVPLSIFYYPDFIAFLLTQYVKDTNNNVNLNKKCPQVSLSANHLTYWPAKRSALVKPFLKSLPIFQTWTKEKHYKSKFFPLSQPCVPLQAVHYFLLHLVMNFILEPSCCLDFPSSCANCLLQPGFFCFWQGQTSCLLCLNCLCVPHPVLSSWPWWLHSFLVFLFPGLPPVLDWVVLTIKDKLKS